MDIGIPRWAWAASSRSIWLARPSATLRRRKTASPIIVRDRLRLGSGAR
jgi:hypothetical protein